METSWQAHSATIWHLDWAHPHHGIILASCSFDKYLRTWMPPVQKNTDFNKRGHHNRDYAQEWEMTGDDCVDRRASVTDVRYVTFVTWSCFIRRKCRLKNHDAAFEFIERCSSTIIKMLHSGKVFD